VAEAAPLDCGRTTILAATALAAAAVAGGSHRSPARPAPPPGPSCMGGAPMQNSRDGWRTHAPLQSNRAAGPGRDRGVGRRQRRHTPAAGK
jgi:hypothetical protein